MKKVLVILLVIVLLAVIGLETYILVFSRRMTQTATGPSITPSPVITPEPPPTLAPVTPVPAPTPEPVSTTPIPAPTAVPTPTPIPAPTEVPATAAPAASDGSFSSDTGTSLNLLVSWRTEDLGNGNTRVYVDGQVSSYSLFVTGTSVSISFGGRSTTASGNPITVPDDSAQTQSALFSTSLDVPSGTVGTMSVDWAFKGSYSGVSLPTVTASGQVSA